MKGNRAMRSAKEQEYFSYDVYELYKCKAFIGVQL